MNKNNSYCVIMAGGAGTRFWPVSRTAKPKQFLDVAETGKTFIRHTYDRFLKILPQENILIVTAAKYRDLVMEQIDGNILAPRVLGDTVGMHPLCIFVSITVMGNLLGVAGLIIGVPIAAVVIEAVKYVCRVRESKTADSADRESVVG
jgi:mannose-1-phosphate guanylyltransferase